MDSASKPTDPIRLSQLFGNLPLLPLLRVHSHLNAASLVLVSLASENWESLVKNDGMQLEAGWDIDITEDEVKVQLNFEKNKKMNFAISFKEDSNLTEEFMVEHNQESDLITCYYQTASQLEPSCFKILRLVSDLILPASFDPEVAGTYADAVCGHINLSLRSRSPDFPFRLLSKLPRGSAKYVDIRGDLEVDGGDLVAVLENLITSEKRKMTAGRLNIDVRIKNLVKSDEVVIRRNTVKLRDARFMTRESLLKLDVCRAEIGKNNFTSQDFNSFFKLWMAGGMNESLEKITFDIREDQKIRMEEVTEGLNPYVGKPRIRDQWKFEHLSGKLGWLLPSAIDLDQGWDITNQRGTLGTVLLQPNQLTFVTWLSRCPMANYRSLIGKFVDQNQKDVGRLVAEHGALRKAILTVGGEEDDEEILKNFSRCAMDYVEEKNAGFLGLKAQKLVGDWSKDD